MLSARRCGALAALTFLLALCGTTTASAHVIASTGYSSIEQHGREVSYRLSLEYDVLIKAVELGPATDDTQRADALEAGTAQLERYLHDRVSVFVDGAACEPAVRGTSIGSRDNTPYAELDLGFSCPGEAGSFRVRYDVFAESEAVVDDHTNLVEYHLDDNSGRFVFDRGQHEFVAGDTSLLGAAAQFGRLGVEHILTGLDHVLFVIALVLGAAGTAGLLKVISTFTVAHSVTLLTTMLGGLDVPAAVVEPLIALSIAFVALENLLGSTHGRLPVVFGFGLLHGLGFAGSLRITDDVSAELALSLLSFNLGIEAGQAFLVVAVLPLILLLRRSRVSVPVIRTATGVVAAFGLFWFTERFFLG